MPTSYDFQPDSKTPLDISSSVTPGTMNNNYTKSVGAIHSWADLNLLGHKLLNGMIYHAFDHLLEEKSHFMTFKQAYEYMGITSRNTFHLKAVVQSIAQVQVEWDFLGEEGNYGRKQRELARQDLDATKSNPRFQKIIRSNYFQKLESDLKDLYKEPKKQHRQINALIEKQLDALFPEFTVASVFEEANLHSGGLLSYSFNMKTAFRLCDPLLYAKVDLTTMRNFKKKGALKLYENGCRYLRVGKSPWLTLELAKKMLGVDRTPSGQFAYPEYATFRQGVIDPAVKEINRFYQEGRCQFSVSYRIKKLGKKVTHVQFIFITLRGAVLEHVSQMIEEKGVNRKLAKELANRYSPEYIKAQIQYVTDRSNQVGFKHAQQGGYLVEALRKNFAAFKSNETQSLSLRNPLKAQASVNAISKQSGVSTFDRHPLTCANDVFEASPLLKGLWLGFVPNHLRERTVQLGEKWQVREVKGLLKQHVPEKLQHDVEMAFRELLMASAHEKTD